ncbi:MAG: DCC1-like thiol-disulfide oxidoreductase family protein [Chloroflexi bacterium]|nr:DCC1-like thiol-disulfide oxidoreductase family protein [Chloroflexota bacterium]
MRKRDTAGRVLAQPNQLPGILERYGLTREQADREAWTIEPSGRRYAGAASINRVVQELGGPWACAAWLYRAPPLRRLENVGYRWFAAHRGQFARWGVAPECDQPDVHCEEAGGE